MPISYPQKPVQQPRGLGKDANSWPKLSQLVGKPLRGKATGLIFLVDRYIPGGKVMFSDSKMFQTAKMILDNYEWPPTTPCGEPTPCGVME